VVALEQERRCVGIELKAEFAEIAKKRIAAVQPALHLWSEESA
jgi:hypothetical protein